MMTLSLHRLMSQVRMRNDNARLKKAVQTYHHNCIPNSLPHVQILVWLLHPLHLHPSKCTFGLCKAECGNEKQRLFCSILALSCMSWQWGQHEKDLGHPAGRQTQPIGQLSSPPVAGKKQSKCLSSLQVCWEEIPAGTEPTPLSSFFPTSLATQTTLQSLDGELLRWYSFYNISESTELLTYRLRETLQEGKGAWFSWLCCIEISLLCLFASFLEL